MATHPGRNDPCPCGSGLKYKNCCEGKLQLTSRLRRGGPWLLVTLVLAAVAIAGILVLRGQNQSARRAGSTNSGTGSVGGNTAGPPAAPWTYDAATNRHFDPAHNHWHDGPPPAPAQRGTAGMNPTPTGAPLPTLNVNPPVGAPAASGSTPAPWTYDQAKNQHWDPNHGHWHPGPPPPTGK